MSNSVTSDDEIFLRRGISWLVLSGPFCHRHLALLKHLQEREHIGKVLRRHPQSVWFELPLQEISGDDLSSLKCLQDTYVHFCPSKSFFLLSCIYFLPSFWFTEFSHLKVCVRYRKIKNYGKVEKRKNITHRSSCNRNYH